MGRMKSYTTIWNVEKVLYAINDLNLPIPITYTQIKFFVLTLALMWGLSSFPPLSWLDYPLMIYGAIPIFSAWFFSQKTLDGKKPSSFLKSVMSYVFRPKVTFAGKAVKEKQEVLKTAVTVVETIKLTSRPPKTRGKE